MRVSATFSYLGDELELEVVLPSHMRVSATFDRHVGTKLVPLVLPSHMRVSATIKDRYVTEFESCPTLSYEGVCNDSL